MPKIEYPDYELIRVDVDADTHVGQLTLNVPKKLNALGVPMQEVLGVPAALPEISPEPGGLVAGP